MRTGFQIGQRTVCRIALLLLGLGVPVLAVPWSSQSRLLFEPVHQNAITRTLRGVLPEAQLQTLRAAQSAADHDERAEDAQLHAMAGVMGPADRPNHRQRDFIARAEQTLAALFAEAGAARRQGNPTTAMARLGAALHLLTDATSPAHRCFQPWDADAAFGDRLAHVWAERITPAHGGNDGDRERLDAAVRWAYDLYTGDQPLPDRFFEPLSGDLQIPAGYGVQNGHRTLAVCQRGSP